MERGRRLLEGEGDPGTGLAILLSRDSSMNKSQISIIEHRVVALATVFLTGRRDVQVFSADLGGEIDLIAKILSDDPYEKLFGVILKGTSRPLPGEREAS